MHAINAMYEANLKGLLLVIAYMTLKDDITA